MEAAPVTGGVSHEHIGNPTAESPAAVLMNGWDEGHPSWWLNLEAHPDAVVRLAGQHPHRVCARPAAGAERDRLWRRWVAVDPKLDTYAGRRSTETPVVVLESREETG